MSTLTYVFGSTPVRATRYQLNYIHIIFSMLLGRYQDSVSKIRSLLGLYTTAHDAIAELAPRLKVTRSICEQYYEVCQ